MLLHKGHVEIAGLYADALFEELKQMLKEDSSILAILVFECHESQGFARNTTTIYIVDRNATFRPTCNIAMKRMTLIQHSCAAIFKSLHPLAVLPMTKEEKEDLDTILGREIIN